MSVKIPFSDFENKDEEIISSSGMDLSEKTRSASFLQQDSNALFSRALSDEVEILDIRQALESVADAKDFYGKAFSLLKRECPKDTEGGYFIRVRKGREVALPIEACLFLKAQGFKQKVHNIIIIEEGAKVYLITGCSLAYGAHNTPPSDGQRITHRKKSEAGETRQQVDNANHCSCMKSSGFV